MSVIPGMTACQDGSAVPSSENPDDSGDNSGTNPDEAFSFKVMTQNLYFGFDAYSLIQNNNLDDPAQVALAAGQLIADYESTSPEGRIRAMGEVIAASEPDLIALQEAMLLSEDGVVTADFITDLLEAIRQAGGPDYQSLALSSFSLSLPVLIDGETVEISFTDREAVFYRPGIDCEALDEGRIFASARDPVTVLGETIRLTRGALGARCVFEEGEEVHFYGTHLDVQGEAAAQLAQAQELMDYVEENRSDAPVIVAGDFNALEGSSTETIFMDDGLGDAYREIFPSTEESVGPTCCQDTDLANVESEADQRFDRIFYVGSLLPNEATVIAQEKTNRSNVGGEIWISDHFGVEIGFEGE